MPNARRTLFGGIALFLLAAFFLWSAKSVLSPIVLGGILLYLLSEVRDNPLMRKVRVCIALILGLWLLVNVQDILIPFLVAFILAYLINPLIDFLERRHLSRLLAVSLVFVIGTALTVLGLVTLVPDLIREIQDLIVRLPQTVQNAIAFAHKHLPRLFAILKIDYMKIEQDFLQNQYPAKVEALMVQAVKALSNMGTVMNWVLYVILVPVLTFYFLKEYPWIKGRFLSFVPRRQKSLVNFYLWRSNRILGGYIRGKVIVAAILGLLTWLGLFLLSVPYAIMIAIVVAVFSLIPFVGFYISLGVAMIAALFMPDTGSAVIKILAVFLFSEAAEAYVISPKIVGERVGLHPVTVIFAILVFSRFLGFWGLLIAVPAAALLKFLFNEWSRHRNWKEIRAEKSSGAKD
jgi:predicted PurR-regulated permease PerM